MSTNDSQTLKEQFNSCRLRFQQVRALMIAVNFATDHDAEFVVSDACAGVLTLIQLLMNELDTLELTL